MTEAEAIQAVRAHFESQFPKTCRTCRREYPTLREYILGTTRQGAAASFDADIGDWQTQQPMGTLALANCPCGTTLALSTEGMALPQRLALLAWVHAETERRGVTPSQLLEAMRDEIRRQVLTAE